MWKGTIEKNRILHIMNCYKNNNNQVISMQAECESLTEAGC